MSVYPRFIFILVLVYSLFLSGCKQKPVEEVKEPVEVELLRAHPQDIAEHFEVGGLLEAEETAIITAEINGTILEQNYRDGDRVSKGAILLRIDPEPFSLNLDAADANLKKAEVNLANSKNEYERRRKLQLEGFLSTEEVDQAYRLFRTAGADFEVAKANRKQAAREMKKTEILSPLPGIIVSRYRELGEQVPPGTPLFKVADIRRLRIIVGVSEEQVLHIKEKQSVTIRFNPFGDEAFSGLVKRIGIPASERGGTFPVEVALSNRENLLKPGMVARVLFSGKMHQGIFLIPRSAIIKRLGRDLVWGIREEKAFSIPITLGADFGFSVAVLQGLTDGDQIVIIGQDKLTEGADVSIRKTSEEIDR